MIEFLKEPHLYLKDGILVKSVTQILQLIFPDKYKGIDKRTLDKKAHVVYLYSGATIENSIIDDVSTLKTDFNEVSFATYYPNVTDLGLIEYAHYKGIRFGIYTVNINSEIIRFVNAGVDEITTDGLNVAEILLNDLK